MDRQVVSASDNSSLRNVFLNFDLGIFIFVIIIVVIIIVINTMIFNLLLSVIDN